MAKIYRGLVFFITFFLLINLSLFCKATTNEDKKTYIVYMGSLPEESSYSPEAHHHSILQRVVKDSSSANNLIRSYTRSFNGFVANLTEQERETVSNMAEVVSVFPNRMYLTRTTRSWDFMGFRENIPRRPSVESDIIIGVIDTGIWPESDSFKDDGFGPPPKKWKGVCHGGQNFTCNNKIIGARYYTSDEGVRDSLGHGTHTASIAAGRVVNGVSFYGLAEGIARGAVPSSRIASYKACNSGGCSYANVLAAFDDAIADGVDVLSVSLGPYDVVAFERDSIAIGSFHAMKNGILTTQAAGNDGPRPSSVESVAPWVFTVAASSTDRHFVDKVVLGNGTTLVGFSVNAFTLNETLRPLIHGRDAKIHGNQWCSVIAAGFCVEECMDKKLVKGKIVLCDGIASNIYYRAYNDGAFGSILNNSVDGNTSFVSPFPATSVIPENYAVALSYAKSASNPEAKILKSEAVKDFFAPRVAAFSSRGPNLIAQDILKPDISAPGTEILAAYSPLAGITRYSADKRRVNYTIMSGTSMACPHAAGAAAYVKTFHPDWSPSAIKSAIMTTALTMNHTSDNEFAFGSGHINPVEATNPGLIYEIFEKDYVNMLCNSYTEADLRRIYGDKTITCDKEASNPKDLNYPSMSTQFPLTEPFNVKFQRRVKNVGLANSTYKANIVWNTNRDNYNVSVTPSVLAFKSLNEDKSFEVSVTRRSSYSKSVLSASLVWSSGNYRVRSPIVLYQPLM